jgi:NAD(P)-dependent dehydrogenase (short-subunit alcohol dehydrogenase family)
MEGLKRDTFGLFVDQSCKPLLRSRRREELQRVADAHNREARKWGRSAMSTTKPRAALPARADIDRAEIAALRSELAVSPVSDPEVTDTGRIDALITLFGGYYAFPAIWEVSQLFKNGRSGLDAFLACNPSLTEKETPIDPGSER